MSEYKHIEIEKKWQKFWAENQVFKAEDSSTKPKYYVLDMFPYPSGAGLHVGHPLGYIASDIIARYKRHKGFNVLHPMGYDSFGLPAEQYAIQTGQHPAITTENNIARYRQQLDNIGFSFDWSREIRTSSPEYYKWTQWIFKQLFNSYYDKGLDRARPIEDLVSLFEKEGNKNVEAETSCERIFSAPDWENYSDKEKEAILQEYRLTYLADTWVNWCEELGTVLANDEVKDGKSERGGFPVEQKLMKQWMMRIGAYAERLLEDLDKLDWSDALKEIQRNWIGKSEGASVNFELENEKGKIEVFTTRPDTIFGVSFMVLAPEHELVKSITTAEQKEEVEKYIKTAGLKTERERQADTDKVTGCFTGAYAIHPFTGNKIPVYIADYVLAGYGTGAVMAVPAGDQRDYNFAKKFNLDIPAIFEGVDISEEANATKEAKVINGDFLNGLTGQEAIPVAIKEIEKRGLGKGKTNFRLRDAVFSRQRYWGEPFPVYFQDGIPKLIADEQLPIELPEINEFKPTKDGKPPLARAAKEDWNVQVDADEMECNTMPGWAGSSWYFARYVDPNNDKAFAGQDKLAYWQNVDLYIGGAEHATGHLLYARFWTKFLFDLGYLPFEEPFKKLINQGMILGRSNFVFRDKANPNVIVSKDKLQEYQDQFPNEEFKFDRFQKLHVDINLVENDKIGLEALRNSAPDFANATFFPENATHVLCDDEVEKMSKSKLNVQNPDDLVEQFGADTLRCYEMFLGPIEQHKPWDTQGITGVFNFLKKFWRLFNGEQGVSQEAPSKEELKVLHATIKKVNEDINRFSFNTVVSQLMICVNELQALKCNKQDILKPLCVLLSPYAPHIAEELWGKLGMTGSITFAEYPVHNEEYLVENTFEYPISFNGKMRFKLELSLSLSKDQVEEEVLKNPQTAKYLVDKKPKKVIVVPKKIVNVVA
ncbi:leucine--tRNA ligase [Luteibaculum oceani]|uniref:Leucine--tRNA ligase n=1 Tax=Luteibaculum oceani TaxID=1294296 RepID=A0A5C6VJQ5_9FLAO|nr:leucine--tRNA ligase [Luteibaculum oceani]TXC85089.1 leucine--tRNA ligase [Luteibaculum oceani]